VLVKYFILFFKESYSSKRYKASSFVEQEYFIHENSTNSKSSVNQESTQTRDNAIRNKKVSIRYLSIYSLSHNVFSYISFRVEEDILLLHVFPIVRSWLVSLYVVTIKTQPKINILHTLKTFESFVRISFLTNTL